MSTQVLIYYSHLPNRLSNQQFHLLLSTLPASMQQQVLKYRHWQDAQRSLLGKALLLTAYQEVCGKTLNLNTLVYNEYQKPMLDSDISFNISHSGNVVVCAISERTAVGIDVEEVKPIPLEDFSDLFSPQELREIFLRKEDYVPFYQYWTKKEAFLKAIGDGLSVPLNKVTINGSSIFYQQKQWFLENIQLVPGYICNLATGQKTDDIILKEISF